MSTCPLRLWLWWTLADWLPLLAAVLVGTAVVVVLLVVTYGALTALAWMTIGDTAPVAFFGG